VALDRPTSLEHGVILAALLDGAQAAARLEHLGGPLGERCRAAHAELAACDARSRRTRIAALSRDLYGHLPAHLERIDPSWVEALLVGEPPTIVGAVAQSLPGELVGQVAAPAAPSLLPAAVRVLVCRVVLGRLAAMPPQAPLAELRAMAELPSWSADRLRGVLDVLGRLALAALAARVDPELRRGLLDRLSTPLADAVRRAMDRPPLRVSRLISVDAIDLVPVEAMLRLGILVLGAAPDLVCREQVAQLLPRRLGLPLLDADRGVAEAHPLLESLQRADREAREESP
jgi:hypothetical protein